MLLAVLTAALAAQPPKAPFPYVWATAYHVLPGTHTDESGYFSLCEGHDGKVYVGTAAYGLNAYLIEFDPKTGQQRVVLDVNKVCGLPMPEKPTYAAQSKIHTRNFVAPSGKIYVGSKQGYEFKGETVAYPGGYVMTYDPATGKAENLGMPFQGEGVNDVTADEKAGLVYVVTCEDHHWVVLDRKTKQFREPDPNLRLTPYAQTLLDHKGRAVVVTRDFRLARFDPAANKLEYLELASDGKPVGSADDKLGPACWAPTADAKAAYLIRMSDSRLFRIDLAADGPKVPVADLGRMIEGKGFDSRGSLIVGHDGKVYALVRVDNETKFGTGYLHHLVSYDPAAKKMRDHGVLGVRNPDWFDFSPGRDGKPKPWSHGFHKLPDGTWTPLHVHMALHMARDGTLYATSIYPFTLLRVEPKDYR
jgi:outer membrane protein assembly factor BamB